MPFTNISGQYKCDCLPGYEVKWEQVLNIFLELFSWKTTSHKDDFEVCLPLSWLLSGLPWKLLYLKNGIVSENNTWKFITFWGEGVKISK